ncbi:DEAD/DEAH box helicase [Raineyella fluvialis]|uniref:DEAD/DEAH box helicase n=1 Tax=Raineyella fluvialis TaxID=2662261 RepID=A0A5Q2F715_9ACTN|nr:DEAD/DEAH box helicase [Raineyella fluvialis]
MRTRAGCQMDPVGVRRGLQDALMRSLDSEAHLGSEALVRERRALLHDGADLVQELLLEPVLPYDSTAPIGPIARATGLTDQETGLLTRALFSSPPEGFKLRQHQADSWQIAATDRGRHNPIVTSGTGSGKTEAFLLPVLSRLLLEGRTWQRPHGVERWWEVEQRPRWRQLRPESPDNAMRTMILYPMNALVEDQIVRLRRALRTIWDLGDPRSGSVATHQRRRGRGTFRAIVPWILCRRLPRSCGVKRRITSCSVTRVTLPSWHSSPIPGGSRCRPAGT